MTERASKRHAFYKPQDILRAVTAACEAAEKKGLPIDYLTFVPDGEPTRDINLGHEIALLKPVGKKIAVITNASLLWRPEVREDLMQADWVSVKVDTVQAAVWRKINRPARSLQLSMILDGLREFATDYPGELVTETMLVDGVNDSESELLPVAQFLAELQPFIAYLALPTRPPAEHWVRSPGAASLTRAYHLFSPYVRNIEFLIGNEGNRFTFSGEVEKDLLSMVNMGPMREDAVREFLAQAQADWSVIPGLIQQGKLTETEYEGETFYLPRVS
jgi:wyosine [tRNA(Phe)-imidazoG37] synthetase (radical SAM superfamily)